MAKRVAEKQLTLENFEEEEEREDIYDTSRPLIASNEVLKTRVVVKAKRRTDLNSSSDLSDEKKPAFSGFSGFRGFGSNTVSNTISSVNPFQSLSTLTANSISQSTPLSLNKPLFATNGSKTQTPIQVNNSLDTDNDDIYNNKLSELNQCFMSHVKTYMEKSKYYDFTTVCREYIDYHQKIEAEMNDSKVVKSVVNEKKDEKSVVKENKWSSIEIKSIPSTPNDSQNSSLFGIQSQSTTSGSSTTPSPISSQASANQFSQPFSDEAMFAKPNIQFGFVGNKFNTNLNNSSNTGTESVNDETVSKDDDNDEPPKVESVVHHESDSLFSKRCKLFYKKGDQFVEKGLGHLFIKKEENSSNAQLLIRADTKLGNVLLNISLVESLPVIKANNNKGVLLTCVPNPPLDPKAGPDIQTSVTFLIRVKTSDDCDLLHDFLLKYKSA